MACHLSLTLILWGLFLIPFDKWGKRPKVSCTGRKWQSRREPMSSKICDFWVTVLNDWQTPSWACLRELGWWGPCPLSRTKTSYGASLSPLIALTELLSVLALLAMHFKKPLLTSADSFSNTLSRLCQMWFLQVLLFCTVYCFSVSLLPLLSSLLSSHFCLPGLHCAAASCIPIGDLYPSCPSQVAPMSSLGGYKAASLRGVCSLLSSVLESNPDPFTY